MIHAAFAALGLAFVNAPAFGLALQSSEVPGSKLAQARALAQRVIVLDGHVDLPYRLSGRMEDVTVRTAGGDFDWPRAVEGGLNAPFMSIYVPASYEEKGGAKACADGLIDLVEGLVAGAPDKFALASSVADVRAAFAAGRIALPMGMENGSPIERDLANLEHFHARGIRYITLCHSKDNHICDSSYDDRHTHGGLSSFGRDVVRRMNELGIMVDVSHVSDATFSHVMDTTKAPVIASHSSLRHFVPGFERNMSDDMVRRLAENGGVIQINFGSSFISADFQRGEAARREHIDAWLESNRLERDDPRAKEYIDEYRAQNPLPYADVSDVADHIERVIELAGVDHVGLGTDFDGVGDSLPTGLKDVSQYPNLFAVLLERGRSEEEIEKIASGNVLRVWAEVERIARDSAR